MGHHQVYQYVWSSLVVQWLGLDAFTAVILGSIPVWGAKIPHTVQPRKKRCVSMYIVESEAEGRERKGQNI